MNATPSGAGAEEVAAVDATGLPIPDLNQGLTEGEVDAHRERFGLNEVRVRRRSVLARLFVALRDPLILVLLAAMVLTVATSDFADATIILTVVVFNTAVGLFQELRAERAISALNEVTMPWSRARRDGRTVEIAAATLFPVMSSC